MTTAPAFLASQEGDHSVTLTLDGTIGRIELAGEIDLVAVPDLLRTLSSVDGLPITLHIELINVTFLDLSGVEPLVEAARRRTVQELPPLLIGGCSTPVRRLLDAAGLDGNPFLDLAAWDHFGTRRPGCRCHGSDDSSR